MPQLEDMDRNKRVLLWEFVRTDGYGSTVRKPEPIPLDVRLVLRSRVTAGPDGRLVSIDAQMASDRDVPLRSLVWEGNLEDWDPSRQVAGSVGPNRVLEVTAVIGRAEDLRGREVRREYGLNYYAGELPART